MSPGDDVLVFTDSGLFRGHRGKVIRVNQLDVRVLIEGESSAMTIERRAVIPVADRSHHMVAGD